MLGKQAIASPDVVVISGDITQGAEPDEYSEAAELVSALLQFLHLDANRLVVTPGNHDIHWGTCEKIFRLVKRRPTAANDRFCIPYHDRFLVVENTEAYERRLDNFRTFYRNVLGIEYPLAADDQFLVRIYNDLDLAIVGYNSCFEIDHYRFRGSISPTAIAKGASALDAFNGTKVAVWHHDLDWRSEQHGDCLSAHSLRYLSERAFHLGLCGHTHRPASNNTAHIDGFEMPILAAGSLCAGPRQRNESLGRSYQILEIEDQNIRVHVRTKETKSSPWKTQVFENADGTAPHYDVTPANRRLASPRPANTAGRRTGGTIRIPSPFSSNSARDADPSEVLEQYVWTEIADRLDTESPPQIILGPRGCGKTALLLSLTLRGRILSPRYLTDPHGVLERIGLLCPMNVDEITAFNSKGWIDREDRIEIFRGLVVSVAAQRLVETLREAMPWVKTCGLKVQPEVDIVRALSESWFGATKTINTLDEVAAEVLSLRNDIATAMRTRNSDRRNEILDTLAQKPLFCGWTALQNAVVDLSKKEPFERTKWWILFDEVEYLNEWQQEVVYAGLTQRSSRLGIKLATLPYAHAKALERATPALSPIHDFEEVVLQFPADRRLSGAEDETGSRDFEALAAAIWESRLRRAGVPFVPIQEVWPAPSYEEVLRSVGEPIPADRSALEDLMIGELTPKNADRAKQLRGDDPSAFGDQYWRRYAQPFRHRMAERAEAVKGVAVPLVWGSEQLLKACDGNCRWFLQLTDECWARYWAQRGLLALSAVEQYDSLRGVADSIYSVCGSLTDKGAMLKQIVDDIAADLRGRIVSHPSLLEEQLNAEVKDLLPTQADAIAVGIAFGYLVPRLDEDRQGRPIYPRSDATLRLGYPIAVRARLPLRAGGTMKVDLGQARFPWLRT